MIQSAIRSTLIKPSRFMRAYFYSTNVIAKNEKEATVMAIEDSNNKVDVSLDQQSLSETVGKANTVNNAVDTNIESMKSVVTTISSNAITISDDFKLLVHEKFKKMPRITSLAKRQDELSELIGTINNPFNLYYLIETCNSDFSPQNLIKFVRKLNYLLKYYNRNNQDPAQATLVSLTVPTEIKTILTRLLIKHVSHMQAHECHLMLHKLSDRIGFHLHDYSIHALLQMLAYYINDFDEHELVSLKLKLEKLKTAATLSDCIAKNQFTTYYLERLEKALHLAAKLKEQEIKNHKERNRFASYFKADSIKQIDSENIENNKSK